jgi:hypothetical protein
MLNPQRLLSATLLRRMRELDAEAAQHERNMRKGEARLPIEEQRRLSLQRVIETNFRTWQVRSNGYEFVCSAANNPPFLQWVKYKSQQHFRLP